MKFATTILALLAASTSVVAVDLSSIPSCALTCIVKAISSAGCGVTDYQCQCVTKSQTITNDATPCIASSCSKDDQAKVAPAVASICASALSSSIPIPTGSAAAKSATGAAASATGTKASSGTASQAAATATSTGAAAEVRGMGAAVLGVAALVMAI